MTSQFTNSGARKLVFPAPLHPGPQPPNEPCTLLSGDELNGVDETKEEMLANDRQSDTTVVHQLGEAWIPAHAVYNDTEEISKRQLHTTDLHFESRFESGNLASAVRLSALEYNLYLRADKGTGGCQWYYFMVSNATRSTIYKFNIMHFYKEKSMYQHGLRPLLWSQKDSKSENPIGWRRAGVHAHLIFPPHRHWFLHDSRATELGASPIW